MTGERDRPAVWHGDRQRGASPRSDRRADRFGGQRRTDSLGGEVLAVGVAVGVDLVERNGGEGPLDYANRDVGIAADSSTREVENGQVVVYLLDVRSKN